MFRKPKKTDEAPAADTPDKDEQSEKSDKQPRTFTEKLWKEWVKPLGILLLVMWAARTTIADWNDVPSGSMEPTIRLGDRIVVNKLAYGLKMPFTGWHMATWGQPQRGDIIVFFGDVPNKQTKQMTRTRLVKRVVAIEGDTIAVRENKLYINGEPVQYAPLGDKPETHTDPLGVNYSYEIENLEDHDHMVMIADPLRVKLDPRKSLRNHPEVTVPEGAVFVMGDNRDNSNDSRGHVGFVKREDISGHAFAIAFSLDYDSFIFSPRWERFFSGLD